MKGLLYREFCIGRKTFFSFLALTLVFIVLGILVCLSMICGNLQEFARDRAQVQSVVGMFTYLPFALSVVALVGVNHTIYSDYTCKWMRYSYTFPTKAVKAVGARFCMGGIVLVLGSLLGVVNALIVNVLAGIAINAEIWKNFGLILLLAILILAVSVPMSLKYKTARAVSNRLVVVLAVIYILCGVKVVKMAEASPEVMEQYYREMLEQFSKVRDMLLIGSPLIVLVLLGISFFLSVKIYQRREN